MNAESKLEGEREERKDKLERNEKKKKITDDVLDASCVSLVRTKYMASLDLSLGKEERERERKRERVERCSIYDSRRSLTRIRRRSSRKRREVDAFVVIIIIINSGSTFE